MAIGWEKEMIDLLGETKVLLDRESRDKLSKDYFWYSPVLDRQLKEKVADGIVVPATEEEVATALAFAYKHKLPVTVRGAGTGNYGQAVPLFGGIVLDMSKLDQIVERGDDYVRVQCGVRLGALEKHLRELGQELRIYPSTFMKATVGGFVCGGSGGIGSIMWGNLWDGNVLEIAVMTMEETPRRLVISGPDLLNYIHNYGTNGIVTELKIPISPRYDWMQTVVQFDRFDDAMLFAAGIAKDDSVRKRLVCPVEWPIPSYFLPIVKHLEDGAAAVLLETIDGTEEAIQSWAEKFNGRVGHRISSAQYRKTIGLSDFSWNHTTLWGLKTDPTITYLQAGFSPELFMDQIKLIKDQFGEEVLLHFEWARNGGTVTPNALPIIRFTTEERLYEIISFFESNGIKVFDPHTWVLNDGGRGEIGGMSKRKRENDPLSLLNPGKINSQSY